MAWFLGAIVGILIMLPPKHDPAIRWKEMQLGWRKSFFGKE